MAEQKEEKMEELRGAPVARAIMDKTAGEITRLAQAGIMPKLAVFRVGSREDDIAYERSIIKRFSAKRLSPFMPCRQRK